MSNRSSQVDMEEWEQPPSSSRFRIHPRMVAVDMQLCQRCGEVRGGFIDPADDRVDRIQRCACHAAPADEHVAWPRYDFNTAIEICFCCCAAIIHTGQSTSPLFCAECLPLLKATDATRATPLPMSRRDGSDPAASGCDMRRTGTVARSMATGGLRLVKSRRREIIRSVLEAFFPGVLEVPVMDFLEARRDVSIPGSVASLSEYVGSQRAPDPRAVEPDPDHQDPRGEPGEANRVPTDYTLGRMGAEKVTRPRRTLPGVKRTR